MNIRRYNWIVLLLLQLVGASAFAEPGRFGAFFGFGKAHPEAKKEAQQQRVANKKSERQEGGDAGDKRVPATVPAGGSNEAQKRNRLTPEERRALRRQINETGREIYLPGR